ncbi:hypothetical protein [Niveispirillum sp.]|uniref:hypothetical protein n=1 Tax=Niveispirillum sp. TaxID=1917217 RepID=UPI001B4ACD87|nr:hypothetical protein [Niveispirillum sp.]MBP7338082.1 hypothetical protein [Niveispirillum sp.]
MSFRERLAWMQLLALLGFSGAYFIPVFGAYLGWATVPGGGQFIWLMVCILGVIVGQIVIAIILAVMLALRSGGKVRSAADERDRQVALLGTRSGFYVLVTGTIAAMLSLHYGSDKLLLVNLMFCALSVAELARLGTIAFVYRRGW